MRGDNGRSVARRDNAIAHRGVPSRRLSAVVAPLAVALLLALPGPALAQVVTCPPGTLPPITSCTVSTTHHETDIVVAGTGVVTPGNAALQNELNQILAGPNGPAILNALNNLGVLGPPTASTKVFFGTSTTVSSVVTIGPGTVLFGPDLTLLMFIPPGSENFNTNTHTESFFEILTGLQVMTSRGINWLIGDLYAAFQTTIFDGNFSFIDSLFDHAHNAGGGTSASSMMPMQYAAVRFDEDGALLGVEGDLPADALGFAGRDRAGFPALLKAPPPPNVGVWSIWAKGEYGAANFANTATNFGFGYHSGGGEFGVDYRKDSWLFGAAIAYDKTGVDQNTTGDTGHIGSVRFGAYTSYQPGPWSFTGALAGGFHSISADRLAAIMLPASSRYGAQSLSAGFEAGRKYALWSGVIQPLAGLVYTDLHTNAFVENGGSLLGLAGNSTNIDSLRSYVGARAWNSFEVGNGWLLSPELRARLFYEALNNQGTFTGQFIADPTATTFPVTGISTSRLGEMLGASLGLRLNPQWNTFVNYDAEIRRKDFANLVSGGVRAKW
jgi:outer membrane autotransporter protein